MSRSYRTPNAKSWYGSERWFKSQGNRRIRREVHQKLKSFIFNEDFESDLIFPTMDEKADWWALSRCDGIRGYLSIKEETQWRFVWGHWVKPTPLYKLIRK